VCVCQEEEVDDEDISDTENTAMPICELPVLSVMLCESC